MHFENELKEISEKHRKSFEDILNAYRETCSGNDSSLSEWDNERKIIEEKLTNEVNKIHNTHFRLQTFYKINHMDKKDIPDGYDFAKFVYFIDHLNREKFNPKIYKYNPDYCDGIMNQIAIEYLRILKALKNILRIRGGLNQKEFNKALQDLHKLWNDIFKNEIDTLIMKDTELTLSEIESRL